METMIGKYKARMKKTGLALIHPVGVSFDLTLDEAVELKEFIDSCQDALATTGSHEPMDRCKRGIKRYSVRSKSPPLRRDAGCVGKCVYRNRQNDQRRWRLVHYRG
jgi:hypothetical protein